MCLCDFLIFSEKVKLISLQNCYMQNLVSNSKLMLMGFDVMGLKILASY